MAGNDMDMESRSYTNNMAKAVADGKVPMSVIDEAVRRILRKKFERGLFDDPFRFCNESREKEALNNPAHAAAARDMARKSIVLLKNENGILPLSKDLKTIALIGPIGKRVKENLGFWSIDFEDSSYITSQWQGLQNKLGAGTKLLYAEGCGIEDTSRAGFAAAVELATQADVVIMSMGERRDMSGEAKSRSNIHLPGVQEELIRAIQATGKPVVVMINAGRPLVFDWTADHVPAILYTWWLGSEAGNAIADVLFGDYNPSAKLPISFPRTEGQIPIYYSHFNTGRPATSDKDRNYRSAYIDLSIYPKFAFGYGLSYTSFSYSGLELSKTTMKANEVITVRCTIANTGKRAGEEIVQLYLRDRVGSVVRPVMELKDFKKILLQPGEQKTLTFAIDKEKLSFYNSKLQWVAEPGMFDLMIGAASSDIRLRSAFELLK
jgi:beta-glucosidase